MLSNAILYSGVCLSALAVLLSIHFYNSKYVWIEPSFTASAYQPNGFYSYYSNHKCCLTVPVREDWSNTTIKYSGSFNAQIILSTFGIQSYTDQQVTDNPSLVANKTIILLHNEYVSQTEFNTFNNSRLILLYPNAMYGLVDYNGSHITLVGDKDHKDSYWDWPIDNTPAEQHNYCNGNEQFEQIDYHYYRLNCWVQDPMQIAQFMMRLP